MGVQEDREATLQATLHYIDQLFASMNKLGALANRILLIQSVLSLILLSLSAGVADTKKELDVGGLGLTASLYIFLTVGALLIVALAIMFAVVERHSMEFGKEIESGYVSIGYNVPTMRRRIANPLRGASLFSTLPAPFLGGSQVRRARAGLG